MRKVSTRPSIDARVMYIRHYKQRCICMESLEIFRVCTSVVARFFFFFSPNERASRRQSRSTRSRDPINGSPSPSLSRSLSVLFTVSVSVCLRVRSDQGRLPAARWKKLPRRLLAARDFSFIISQRGQRNGTERPSLLQPTQKPLPPPSPPPLRGQPGAFIAKKRFIRCLSQRACKGVRGILVTTLR